MLRNFLSLSVPVKGGYLRHIWLDYEKSVTFQHRSRESTILADPDLPDRYQTLHPARCRNDTPAVRETIKARLSPV